MKRTSKIWQLSKEEFSDLIKRSKTYTEILAYWGMENKGNNHKTLKKRMIEDGISGSHLNKAYDSIVNLQIQKKRKLEDILVKDSDYSRSNLKKRLLKEKLLENKCSICELTPIWNNQVLVLVLDHINGISNDNRLENLRLVCPNCNSQLSTFCGKHNKKKYFYCACGKEKLKESDTCVNCYNEKKKENSRLKRPDKEVLIKEIENNTFVSLGLKYGVSDNTIKKWAEIENINLPPRISKEKKYCLNCQKEISKQVKTNLCKSCFCLSKTNKNKPEDENLLIDFKTLTQKQISEKYNRTISIIRAWKKN